MSRIGKKPIKISEGIKVSIKGQAVTIEGPKGELTRIVRPEIKVEVRENEIILFPKDKSRKSKAYWGLERALLANMVEGVSLGFKKELELVGVGFKAKETPEGLTLRVGFSHSVEVEAPEGISLKAKNTKIEVSGIDKEKVGQIAAKIRAIKPPEPYKGKGIRYVGEAVRRKPGKAGKVGVGFGEGK